MVDTIGAIFAGRGEGMTPVKKELAVITNKGKKQGRLAEVIAGADVFIGVSKAGVLTAAMVKSMNSKPIIFAMANPVPEIMPNEARSAGAAVVSTGRSDFPNQINNSLAFPGIFRGALDCRASEINEEMKLSAAHALASLVPFPTADKIVPEPLDHSIVPAVSKAVASAAYLSGIAKKEP